MGYGTAGFAIALAAATLAGFGDWELEHNVSHAALAWYCMGIFMIFGSDWILQRTAWGRKRSGGMESPDLDALSRM